MGIVIQNSNGSTDGQNWINSTNFPISGITYTISGVSNALTPATNSAGSTNSMDPNNCAGSTIQPGGSCEFYIQLNKEAFGVQSQESINISISYTVNDTLFGGSTNTASASTTIYELTNLYIGQNNGYMNIYNNAWSNYGLVESADTIAAIAADTSSYGNIYLGGVNGIYPLGITASATTSSSISSTTFPTGSNNLFSIGTSLYAAQSSTTSSGTSNTINSYVFSSESWSSSPPYGASTNFLGTQIPNANAYTGSNTYIAMDNNNIIICKSPTNTCSLDIIQGIIGNITSLSYSNQLKTVTTSGLYAGTDSNSGGLFYESITLTFWAQVTGESNPVTAMTSSTSQIYVGDSIGNVSYIASTSPTTAIFIGTTDGSSILSMVYDTNGGVIYVSTRSNQLYACNPKQSGGCINTYSIQTSGKVTGMTIGSMLVDSLNQLYDNGSL